MTISTAAVIGLLYYGRPLLVPVAFAKRLPRGAGYAIRVRPLVAARPGESATRRLNRALEELVAECPEQYLWGYNRYKTPAGAKPYSAAV